MNLFSKSIGIGLLTVLCMISLAQTSIWAQGVGARALEGSWSSIVTFRVCQTGAAIRSFPSMNTFSQGGTMQEYGVGSGLLRGPGHGVWSYEGDGTFKSAFQFFRYNADGTDAGRAVGRRLMEVDASGNNYISTNTTDFYSPAGVFQFSGCATEVGTRFE